MNRTTENDVLALIQEGIEAHADWVRALREATELQDALYQADRRAESRLTAFQDVERRLRDLIIRELIIREGEGR